MMGTGVGVEWRGRYASSLTCLKVDRVYKSYIQCFIVSEL